MNYRLTCSLFLTLTLTIVASGQGKPGGGGGAGHSGSSPSSSSGLPSISQPGNVPSMNSQQPRALISGKVVLDDGTEITDSAMIMTICAGSKRAVAHTDSHGGFSFEFGDRALNSAGIADAGIDTAGGPMSNGLGRQMDWRSCEVMAELPGFTSQPIDLSSRLSSMETSDIGHLVLHRVGQVEGLTISATSAMAPKDAQKAYSKGYDKATKQKWEEAQQLLSKAVEIYPRYAVAWYDLGRVQIHNNDAVAARHSFEQSIAADAKYVNPYRGLAQLDTQQQNWQELVTVTGKLLALNPVYFPDAWFLNALGNYYLENFKEAEKSARQGIKLDDQHHFPRLEYLLGLIQIQTQNYSEAATHVQNYLKTATQPSDIADAQKQLAEINRLSASVSDPVTQKK